MAIFKALTINELKQKTPLTLVDYEEPTLESHEILIQNVSVAQNPIDWKQVDTGYFIPSFPWTNGGDVAGIVYKIGDKVTKFKVGDRIIAYLDWRTPRHGGYQTYSIALETRSVKLPDSISFEAGSTIPLAFVTAGAGFIDALELPLPPLDASLPIKSNGEPVLIWGGSSSVGCYAIQIAKLAGFTVLTTASPANFDYVKSLGADRVFDYHDGKSNAILIDVVDQIRTAAGDKLSRVFDAISENGSVENSVKAITAPSGRVAVILGIPTPDPSTENIKVIMTGGLKATTYPDIGQKVYGLLDKILQQGKLIPNRVKIMPGGLLGVNEGFQLGRAHKVSGEKLVYRIADTKF